MIKISHYLIYTNLECMTLNFILLSFLIPITIYYNATTNKENKMRYENDFCASDNDLHFEATSLGELLRKTRELRGITLKEIAAKTKIHVGVLTNLEKNNFAELPCKPYVSGFVKSMANVLGIAPKRALDLLEVAYSQLEVTKGELVESSPNLTDHFIIQKLSDLKFPEKIPQITKRKMSGVFLILIGVFSIGVGSHYIQTIKGQNISEQVSSIQNTPPVIAAPVVPVAPVEATTAPIAAEPAAAAELEKPKTSYPLSVSLTFPKTLKTINAEGFEVPANHF